MKIVPGANARNDAEKAGATDAPESGRAPAGTFAKRATSPTTFKLTERGLKQSAAQGYVIEAATPNAAFAEALHRDVSAVDEPLWTWSDGDQAVALDFDRPDEAPPLIDADIETILTPNAPKPAFAWVTHGAGLRLLFFKVDEVSALALAGVWLMLAYLGRFAAWRLEVKTDTRHPLGLRDGKTCGEVFEYVPTSQVSLRGSDVAASEAEIGEWLEARGLTYGRHGTELCPWYPKACSGSPSVTVTQWGIRCFHCNTAQSWPELVGAADPTGRSLRGAARALVHLGHQKHVLGALYPFMPTSLIEPAWSHLVRVVNADRLQHADLEARAGWEKRITIATSSSLDIARSSSGGWLDDKTLVPRKVSVERTLKHLPFCLWPPMVDKADNAGPLDGFIPLHPIGVNEVVGPRVTAPRGTLMVRRGREEGDPPAVDLTSRPTPEQVDEAWVAIEGALPGISRGYHSAIVAAMLVAQRGVGTPPIICATGQSGSAKTAQIHLAAGVVGSKASQITLGTTDDTTRKAGLGLEEGAGVLFADEIGRVDGVFGKLEPILSANSTLRFRAKYANERAVPLRAAIMLVGSTIPDAIVRSPEVGRRSVGFRLAGADKNWSLIDPASGAKLDLSEARKVPWLRPHLDIVTAAIWWRISDLGPAGDWRALLLAEYGAVALHHLDLLDSDGTQRIDAILALYDRFRTAKASELSTQNGWKGFLIADLGTPAGDELNVLVDIDGDTKRFHAQASDLERLNLGPVLGFTKPQLQLYVRRRSPHTLVKFVEVNVMKGKGLPRTELPAPTKVPVPAAEHAQNVTVTL